MSTLHLASACPAPSGREPATDVEGETAPMTAAASNVVPLSRARVRRMRVVHNQRTHLLEQRDDLLSARTRLSRAHSRVTEQLSVVDAQLAVLDDPDA